MTPAEILAKEGILILGANMACVVGVPIEIPSLGLARGAKVIISGVATPGEVAAFVNKYGYPQGKFSKYYEVRLA